MITPGAIPSELTKGQVALSSKKITARSLDF